MAKQVEADVVVVAAGTAGMAAAVTAAEQGISVAVFEKAAAVGGAGNMARGPFAVESNLQKLRKIAISKEEAFNLHMDYTHWRVDARLVSEYINKSASTIDWLEKLGVEFIDVQCHNYGYKFTWHIIKGPLEPPEIPGTGVVMMKLLTEKFQELGGKFYFRTPVKKILKRGGRIAGVIAEGKSDEEIQANAKAVIVATGGFVGSREMLKKHTGFELERDILPVRKSPALAGDGIRMAWEVGASPTVMNVQMAHDIPGLEFMPLFRHPNLIVNLAGERFMNEEATANTTFFGNAIARQKNRWAFMIVDEDTKKYYDETGPGFTPPGIARNIDEQVKQAINKGNKHIFVANSLEDLCAQTGINLEGLRKTIKEYNIACETGYDELFFKKAENLRAVKQPKFYTGRILPHALGTLGGIRINYKTEVLNKKLDVIPGLYAAGLDANSICGDSYPWILSGNTFGFAINSGRIAGENAVDYLISS